MVTTSNPETRHSSVASHFERQLKRAAQALSRQHRNWRAAAESEWDPLISRRVLVKPGTDIPSQLIKPRARTFEQLVFPKALQAGPLSVLANLILLCAIAGAAWFVLGGGLWEWGRSWGGDPLVWIIACIFVTAVLIKTVLTPWRADKIAEDARTAVRGRAPYLDDVFLLDDLGPDSRKLLESYLQSAEIRPETKWAVAQLLLEADMDRRELDRYNKLLPAAPTSLDPAHPLHEVLGNIQQRINARLLTIASQVADDVATAARTSEAAR